MFNLIYSDHELKTRLYKLENGTICCVINTGKPYECSGFRPDCEHGGFIIRMKYDGCWVYLCNCADESYVQNTLKVLSNLPKLNG